jgi:hypothetical protein
MRRAILSAMLFLLLGVIANVAVAWTLALWHSPNLMYLPGTKMTGTPSKSPVWESRQFNVRYAVSMHSEVGWFTYPPIDWQPPSWSIASEPPPDEAVKQVASVQEQACGWPMLSVLSRRSWDRDGEHVLFGFPIGERYRRCHRILPVLPIWTGFAINTVFYGAILWLLFAAARTPGAVRRWQRVRRGLCPVCAYPVGPGKSANCSECGKPVLSRGVVPV